MNDERQPSRETETLRAEAWRRRANGLLAERDRLQQALTAAERVARAADEWQRASLTSLDPMPYRYARQRLDAELDAWRATNPFDRGDQSAS